MNEQPSLERWEARVQRIAQGFSYPPTPDVAGAVRQRLAAPSARPAGRRQRLAWVAAGVLVLVALMTIPAVQSQVLELVGLGAGSDLPTPTLVMPTLTVTELATSTPLTATPSAPAIQQQPASTPLSLSVPQTVAELPIYSPARPVASGPAHPNFSP